MKTGKWSTILSMTILWMLCVSCEKKEDPNILIDIDGNRYRTIQIGSQVWMAENLRVTRDKHGDLLETYCYDGRSDKCEEFGRLYTWEAAINASPEGWRLPDAGDWKELELELGMDAEEADSLGWRGTDQGTQLKEGGTSGFEALLAGYKDGTVQWDGRFFDMGYYASFWSATEYDAETSTAYWMYTTSEGVLKHNYDKTSALSVRCIKD
jgi:uncharacterized protein (TIGR02145 family)